MLKLIIFENNWERMVLYDDWKVKYGLHNNNITKIMSTQQDQKYFIHSCRYELLISALRANQRCKKERQNFNLIKSSVSGQIEPSVSRNSAIDLLDCFNRVYHNPHSEITRISSKRKEKKQWMHSVMVSMLRQPSMHMFWQIDAHKWINYLLYQLFWTFIPAHQPLYQSISK